MVVAKMGLLKMAWRRVRKVLAWVVAIMIIVGGAAAAAWALNELGWLVL